MPTPAHPLDFTGRSILITGAASGIGAACVRWLSAAGAERLVLIDIDADALGALQLETTAECHAFDVSDPAKWAELEETLGTLDHVIVNAGIGGSGEFADLSFSAWRKVMDVNLDGAFLTLAAGLRAMKKKGKGSAVVTASITGVKPVPGIGPYGVAKAAVAHMARIAAAENAKNNIRVNAIAPGGVDTAIWEGSPEFLQTVADHGREFALKAMAATTPRGTFATSDEIAGEVGFLLSDMAANITGVVHVTDGGFSF